MCIYFTLTLNYSWYSSRFLPTKMALGQYFSARGRFHGVYWKANSWDPSHKFWVKKCVADLWNFHKLLIYSNRMHVKSNHEISLPLWCGRHIHQNIFNWNHSFVKQYLLLLYTSPCFLCHYSHTVSHDTVWKHCSEGTHYASKITKQWFFWQSCAILMGHLCEPVFSYAVSDYSFYLSCLKTPLLPLPSAQITKAVMNGDDQIVWANMLPTSMNSCT